MRCGKGHVKRQKTSVGGLGLGVSVGLLEDLPPALFGREL
jgi:hypothetical protein